MDCKHARMLLDVAHPLATELEAVETEALAAHLAECPDCGFAAEAERRVDEKFGAAMRDVPVPDGLQQRIVRRLQGERDAWWRARVFRAASAAAAPISATIRSDTTCCHGNGLGRRCNKCAARSTGLP